MNTKMTMAFVLGLSVLMAGCSTVDGLKNDLSSGYNVIANTFAKIIDPKVEAKKKLPVFDGMCPPISVRPDLSSIVEFYNPKKITDNTKISQALITGISNTCRVEQDKIIMQIDLSVSGTTGPKARVKETDKVNFTYPYFIAVTNANGDVVSKEILGLSLGYDSKATKTTITETIFQNLPVPDSGAGESYAVIVGFQLTPEQLEYNNKTMPNLLPENTISNAANAVR